MTKYDMLSRDCCYFRLEVIVKTGVVTIAFLRDDWEIVLDEVIEGVPDRQNKKGGCSMEKCSQNSL